jgi:hypothetical protein
MSDEIPQWAKERACELANAIHEYPRFTVDHLDRDWPSLQAFARYIAAHEEPPVDPLLVEARKIACGIGIDRSYGRAWQTAVASGADDQNEYILGALAGLKRGIELASERQS